ncbi:hypothetical protein J132_10465 [Termitomyces sp. J132]|nr:hypothetical protein J132_10465 [Termitomyces sp. J132]
MSENLELLLHNLRVPTDYARIQHITEDSALVHLDEWKDSAERVLTELELILNQKNLELSLNSQADVIQAAASFDGQDSWVTPIGRTTAQGILRHFDDLPQSQLTQILNHNVKPLFQFNPHPNLNASGRKLPRPAGGPMATHDFYDDQMWKAAPGVVNLVSWCIRHVHRDWYETLWHLVIPPVMALLDDFEAHNKLRGVGIVSEMLREVPSQLLRRTGVDGLIRSSLNTCLTHLNDTETPQLIEAAVDAYLTLTLLTTEVGSSEQFDQLCALLGEGVIRGIWLYASDRPDVVLASLRALPPLLRTLKIGNARFLKVLITQLLHPLKTNVASPWLDDIQIASLRLLSILIEECAPCIPRWKTTILDAVARCWVTLKDSGKTCRRFLIRDHLAAYDVTMTALVLPAGLNSALRHTCNLLGQCVMMEVRRSTVSCP